MNMKQFKFEILEKVLQLTLNGLNPTMQHPKND